MAAKFRRPGGLVWKKTSSLRTNTIKVAEKISVTKFFFAQKLKTLVDDKNSVSVILKFCKIVSAKKPEKSVK